MKKLMATVTLILTMTLNYAQNCIDIDTKKVVSYLNEQVKPKFDLKLDKDDGFLAIQTYGRRQNFSVPPVSIKPISRKWTYHFEDVRRMDSNFFYDSKKNQFALDVNFEDNGPELKGLCPGCIRRYKDSRAPDVNWKSPSILRIFLVPNMYQNSISFRVTDIRFIGKFEANGLGKNMIPVATKVEHATKKELIELFNNGGTQRLFNNALKPLLDSNNVSRGTSVSLAAESLRICN